MANKKSDNKNDIKDTNKKKNMIKKTDEKKQKIKTTENNEEKIDNKVVNKMNSSTKIKSKKPKKEEIEQNKVKEEKKDSKVVNKKSSSVKKKTNDTTIENKEITKVENKEEEFFDIVDDKKKKKNNNNKIKKSEYYDILENDKSHLLLNIIILLLLIGAGIFLVYKYVIRDPKTIFTTGITRIYEEAANKIVKLSKSIITSDKQKLSGVLTLNTSDNNYNNLNNYVYDIDLNMDKTNHNYGLELNIKNQDTILSTLNYYFVNNMFYLNLGKNYNKSILLKQDIFDLNNDIFNINTINFNKLNNSAKQIKNIINSNINRKKLTMGEENLNDTTYEYVEYSLDNTSYSNLISKIIDDIKNNNNLINDLTEAFNTNNETVIDLLDNILKNNLTNNFNNITYRFYIDGFMANIIGFNISIDNNNIFNYFNINDEIKFNLTINDYTLSFYKENNKYNAVIKENNIDYITLLFNELNDNTIDVDYKNIKQDYYGNIHLSKYDKSNDKSGNLKFSIVTKNNTSSFNLDYKFNSINEIKVIEPIIDADNISEEDIELIENNINLNINDKLLHDYFTNILDLINTY